MLEATVSLARVELTTGRSLTLQKYF